MNFRLMDVLKVTEERQFLAVPFLLALLDLAFFLAVPFCVLLVLQPAEIIKIGLSPSAFGTESVQYLQIYAVCAVGILSVIRICLIRLLENRFVRSISAAYSKVTRRLVDAFFLATEKVCSTDDDQFRKVINAELNNLFFGVLVSSSFAAAEVFIAFTALSLAIAFLGVWSVLAIAPVFLVLVVFLFFVRGRAKNIGSQRTESEESRQQGLEILIASAFSISLNGGKVGFNQNFSRTTESFATALGAQLIAPFWTRSAIDGFLLTILAAALLFVSSEGLVELSEAALLFGIGLRALPALSRMSAYVETIRISQVGAMEAISFEEKLQLQRPISYENQGLLNYLQGLKLEPGVHVIRGQSGAGKTLAIKKWIGLLGDKVVAYADQGGFANQASIKQTLSFLGVDKTGLGNTFLDKFQTLDRSMSSFSGGQSRFVYLTLLLSKQTDVLILDEPSVGLDPGLKSELLSMIAKRAECSVVLIVTHEEEFAETLMSNFSAKKYEIE